MADPIKQFNDETDVVSRINEIIISLGGTPLPLKQFNDNTDVVRALCALMLIIDTGSGGGGGNGLTEDQVNQLIQTAIDGLNLPEEFDPNTLLNDNGFILDFALATSSISDAIQTIAFGISNDNQSFQSIASSIGNDSDSVNSIASGIGNDPNSIQSISSGIANDINSIMSIASSISSDSDSIQSIASSIGNDSDSVNSIASGIGNDSNSIQLIASGIANDENSHVPIGFSLIQNNDFISALTDQLDLGGGGAGGGDPVSLVDGNGTTANFDRVDLGGVLNQETNIEGDGNDINFDNIGEFNVDLNSGNGIEYDEENSYENQDFDDVASENRIPPIGVIKRYVDFHDETFNAFISGNNGGTNDSQIIPVNGNNLNFLPSNPLGLGFEVLNSNVVSEIGIEDVEINSISGETEQQIFIDINSDKDFLVHIYARYNHIADVFGTSTNWTIGETVNVGNVFRRGTLNATAQYFQTPSSRGSRAFQGILSGSFVLTRDGNRVRRYIKSSISNISFNNLDLQFLDIRFIGTTLQ